jgi:ABC-2 type transport system ATP-binding protein
VALQHLLLHGFPGVTLFGNQIHVLSQSPEQDRERITGSLAAAGLATRSIAPQPLSMEDVFVYRITQLEQKARTQSERKKEAAS